MSHRSLLQSGNVHIRNARPVVVRQVHHLLGEIPLVQHLLLARLPQLEVLALHLRHFLTNSVHLKTHPTHLLVCIL